MFKTNLSLKRAGDSAENKNKVPKIAAEDQAHIKVLSNVLLNPDYDMVSLGRETHEQSILYNMLAQSQRWSIGLGLKKLVSMCKALVPKTLADSEDESFIENDEEEMLTNEEDSDSDSSPCPSMASSLQSLIDTLDWDQPQPTVFTSSSQELHGEIISSPIENLQPTVLPLMQSPLENQVVENIKTVDKVSSSVTTPPKQKMGRITIDPSPFSSTRSGRKRQLKSTRAHSNVKGKKSKIVKKKKQLYHFDDADFAYDVDIEENDFDTPDRVKTELEYFLQFFSEDIFDLIVEQSNLYSVQKKGTSINFTIVDMRDFIAIQLMMGICKMPAYTDYWSDEYGYGKIKKVMPRNKYKTFRAFLHFSDNSLQSEDRYSKIRPLFDLLQRNFRQVPNEKRQAVDEMMVPYKGTMAGNRRQYVKNKPHKWGYKIFVRDGASGIVYDFLPYGGGDTFTLIKFPKAEEEMGLGAKVVLALCQTIPVKATTAVYIDNFFTSLQLLHRLRKSYGILAVGTLRADRTGGAIEKSKGRQKKPERGSIVQKCDNNAKLTLIKWFDNKDVLMASNYVGSLPISFVKRCSKIEKKKVDVRCPKVIKEYNQSMGGVDLADMLIALYRTSLRTKRWYLAIFSQMLDICVNNGWLMMRRDHLLFYGTPLKLTLKTFRMTVANCLLTYNRAPKFDEADVGEVIRNPTAPRPPDVTRYDMMGHFPSMIKRGRCKLCKGRQTDISCEKCKMRLCLNKNRNCFTKFHTE